MLKKIPDASNIMSMINTNGMKLEDLSHKYWFYFVLGALGLILFVIFKSIGG